MAGVIQARRLLKKIKPDMVFSKGGFVVVPVGIAARLQNIPIITHDSDAVPGLANRVVGRWALLHTTGMPPHFYGYRKDTIRHVGIPLDERISPVTKADQLRFKKELGLSEDSQVLLVGGAGLGAQKLNGLISDTAAKLLEQIPNLHIIHFTGPKHLSDVNHKYQTLPKGQRGRVMAFDFKPDFYKYTGASDLVVTRAGATTIAELALQRKAAILIPAPQLTAGQQLKNAEEIAQAGAAVVEADDVRAEQFSREVTELLGDSNRRRQLADKLGTMAKADAASQLAEIILSQARRG